jgi:hypothetical protein
MKGANLFRILALLFTASIFFACDGGGGSSGGGSSGVETSVDEGTGTVSVGLTDSTTDLYRGVYITIIDLQICSDRVSSSDSSDNDCKWMSLDPPDGMQFPLTYNLLKLVNGVTEAIGSGEFSAGEYHQVRLIIGRQPELENNLLGEPHPEANYVILNDGNNTIKPLKVPSGPETGLKLVHSFTVGDGEIKELVLDFDACRSVIKAGNSGMYILKPTITVIEPDDKIDVYGIVEDSETFSPIPNATVSAQISDGLSATVIRSTVTNGVALEEGEYLLSHLSPDQIYNIVAYKDYVDGDEFIYSPECMAFRFNDAPEAEPRLDFLLTKASDGIGTISGEVRATGEIDSDFALVVTVYTDLDCGRTDGEGYVEITMAEITDYLGGGVFEYSVNLPIYNSSTGNVTYYVVASADDYIPATNEATLTSTNPDASEVNLVIEPSL